jgi:hypothetical protein
VKTPFIHHGRSYNVQPYRIRHYRNLMVVRPCGQWCL